MGEPGWVSRVPDYVLALPLLHALMPDLVYIDCVRDPRAVASTVLPRAWGPSKPREAGAWWAQRVTAGRSFAEAHPGAIHAPSVPLAA